MVDSGDDGHEELGEPPASPQSRLRSLSVCPCCVRAQDRVHTHSLVAHGVLGGKS
jgi:hypothetical protein